MTTLDKIKHELNHLDEKQLKNILSLIYYLQDKDLYDGEGQVIVDDFYRDLIAETDEKDPGQVLTEADLRKKLAL
ncbi:MULTISPECIES: hypothetical protein [Aerococcus]|uniref:hypothetical protein n=1 Tax=Aerococcus TaxID=1375 RepID=UPI000200ED6D|nr:MULTISPECIES: hypothetical protein [Aerococcus]AEA01440.1 hypothetical protein HMPREF9243_0331 [Aerococcus sp. Group 1]MCY3030731.1 hypothetical protein [Aerococcus sp. Group 1]MCY3055120.1 hypothetical protein [Aerococcus sp. Group 1]MCY3056850.1 hypothetical protein [Aerococcus sp. Group 1]MCY3062290.1 hypothetical protein [Aerococcus sp. Group 1]